MATISSSVPRTRDLFNDEPVIRGAARSVSAVPVLQHDAAKALSDQRLAPGTESTRHVRSQADIDAGHEQALEVPFALQQRDLDQGLAVDLQQVEGGEDLAAGRVSRERVAVGIELELRLIAPVRDEDAVDDRRAAVRLGHDRVVQLAWPIDLAAVAQKTRPLVPDTRDRARSHPVRFEDVVRQLRAFAGVARSLGRELRAQNGLQL